MIQNIEKQDRCFVAGASWHDKSRTDASLLAHLGMTTAGQYLQIKCSRERSGYCHSE
jgi:hypothetical protein